MTPKEKAQELVNKYLQVYDGRVIQAKQCALIAVDEILKEKEDCHKFECHGNDINYWQEVKQELDKL